MKTIDNNLKNNLNVIPDFIETNLIKTSHYFKIPTNNGVEFRSERRSIIKNTYKLLLSSLNGQNFIKNDFLNENVYIIWKES